MEINITILFQIATFLVLLGWLSRFLFKPLLQLVDERERRIDGARSEAHDIMLAAHERKKEVEVRIGAAQKEARTLLDSLKKEGIAYQQAVIEKAHKDAQEQLAQGFAQLAVEAQKVRADVHSEVVSLANAVVAKFAQSASHGNSSDNNRKMECHSAS